MGDVAISIKIMPKGTEVDLEKVKSDIEEKMKVQDSKIEPLAFGIKCLKILLLTPDRGGTDEIEKQIKEIDGVETVEVEDVSLI